MPTRKPKKTTTRKSATRRPAASKVSKRKAAQPAIDAQREFDKLARKYFDWIVRNYPAHATYLGIHEFDDRMTDYAPSAVQKRHEKIREFYKQFKAIPVRGLDLDSKIERQLIVDQLFVEDRLNSKRPLEERDPGLFLDDGVYSCYCITIRDCGDAEESAQKMTDRLLALPKMLGQGKRLVTKPTKIDCEVALLSASGAINFFKDTVAKFAKRVKDSKIRHSMRDAAQAAEEAVEDYMGWLKTECMPKAQVDFALGPDLFDLVLRKQHQLSYEYEELFKLGRRVYKETIGSLQAISRKLHPTFTWDKVVEILKRDHPTNSELVQYYADEMKRAKRFVIEHRLVDIPEGERIDVVPTPEFARPTIPYAAYMPPAPYEKEQRGIFWVTPVDRDKSPAEMEEQLRGHSVHGIVVTALHEAYPGHHLQLTVANQMADRPLRTLLWTSVFAEGWALYCEQMMAEQNFYDDYQVKLLQLKDQLWRACRVMLDVGLHCKGWTFNQGVKFLVEKARLERPNAEAEVRRYCQTPTQPMSYIVGKLQVQSILRDYRRKRGNAFNLRQFHNELLRHGSLPLKQIRVLMDLPETKAEVEKKAEKKPAKKSVKKSEKSAAKATAKKTVKKVAKKPASKATTRKPASKGAKKPAKTTAKKAAKKAAKK